MATWSGGGQPYLGPAKNLRQGGDLGVAWAAQARLCGKFRRLAQKKNSKKVVATAIARELWGFLWAEMTA